MTRLQRKWLFPLVSLAVVLLLLWLYSESTYTVAMDEHVIVLRLNKPIIDYQEPGLHFKIPLADNVISLPRRVQSWEGRTTRRETKDKHPIYVKAWARWQVSKPREFLRTVKTVEGARETLDRILDGAVGEFVASHDLIDLVRSTSEPLAEEPKPDVLVQAPATQPRVPTSLPTIEVGQAKLVALMREHLRAKIARPAKDPGLAGAREYGFVLVDFGLTRIMHPDDYLEDRVYKPMRAKQEGLADVYRQEATRLSKQISEEAEQWAKDQAEEADRWVEVRKGQAEAEMERERNRVLREAVDIREAGDMAEARTFIAFVQSLEALKVSLEGKAELILTTDSEFLRLLKRSGLVPASQPRTPPTDSTGPSAG